MKEHRRKYKSGSRWAFWRWTEVPSEFITRLHLIMTPWFAIVLHWIRKPDPEPHLHDHPVTFLSLILRGGYNELREHGPSGPNKDPSDRRWRRRRWFNFFRASPQDRHRITHCDPRTTTLCFMGPKRREWGYHTPFGWVHYKEYQRRVGQK